MSVDFRWKTFAQSLDNEVTRVLENADIHQPPVDPIRLARRLGIGVVLDAAQEPRGRQTRIAGRPSIFVRLDDRPERLHWAVAHELGETLAHQLFQQSGVEPADIDPPTRERGANLAAARLLIPPAWFPADVERTAGDLLALKRRYETASHELIAFRMLDLAAPAVVTVFDQGRQTRRRGNLAARVPPLDRLEQECWLAVRRFGRMHEVARDGRRIQGWPIHEPQWQREILRTTCVEWGPEEPPVDD
ncbi:MAG TPA: ImmA/IrrE family metallo-endopeptidase [Planctomycetaceae bacterium]|jgi:Zn-dependent peptidase ImmA (M78 family)|nr:ImmA/IrrE family metallo-endopeptidase [Planctomycetaceae bacterium]